MPSKVIVLVPGGLGTRLSLDKVKVWDSDLSGTRMLINPSLLDPWLDLDAGGLLSIYDDLIQFLVTNGGYTVDTDLFPWGFDWRLGMEANALALAQFANALVLGGKKILFIAHSSGCMVVRWALHMDTPSNIGVPLIDNSIVEQVVAAGPPMLGIPSAFKDMIEMPRLNDLFDALYFLVKLVFPTLAAQVSEPLNRTLMGVTAQLEMLPPNMITMLQGGKNPPAPIYGVFDWRGWPSELKSARDAAQATTQRQRTTPWGTVPCTIIAGTNNQTATGYVLDAQDHYHSDLSTTPIGDDSVLLSSALAYCSTAAPVIVSERHRTLLDDPVARTFLQTVM
jgi:hypothetical protein